MSHRSETAGKTGAFPPGLAIHDFPQIKHTTPRVHRKSLAKFDEHDGRAGSGVLKSCCFFPSACACWRLADCMMRTVCQGSVKLACPILCSTGVAGYQHHPSLDCPEGWHSAIVRATKSDKNQDAVISSDSSRVGPFEDSRHPPEDYADFGQARRENQTH